MPRKLSIFTYLVAASLLLLVAALTSCAPDTSAPELQREVAEVDVVNDQAPSDTAESDTTDTGKTVAQVAFTDQACLDCHTDQARLQELAVEEENEGESLSEGPG